MFYKCTHRVSIILVALFLKGYICQFPDSECYAVDARYFVEIPVSAYEGSDLGFETPEAKTRCQSYCHSSGNALYYGLKRNSLNTGRARCYCADTLPDATTTGCNYTCPGTACGGNDRISVYQVCPTSCIKENFYCDIAGSRCVGCINGYQGVFCDQTCPENCASDRCQQINGVCDGCEVGYYGNFCDQTCPENCAGDICQQSSGVCDGCNGDFYGSKCNITCPSNCEGQCNQTTGNCPACQSGWYGDRCDKQCPSNCDGQCSQSAGNCPACQNGWYGYRCDKRCFRNCEGQCFQVSGRCPACQNGWYGFECDHHCPSNCEGQCYRYSGICPACQNGWYGLTCDKQCPSNCLNHVCNQSDETCTYGCEDGWYGDLCNKLCPQTCKEKCERDSGDCTNGCDDGFHGTRCNINCSTNCVSLMCNQGNGFCTQGCVDMWYGDSCVEPCPANCTNSKCEETDGTCTEGCVDGWYGVRCDQRCPDNCVCDISGVCPCQSGLYGVHCNLTCPSACRNRVCHVNTGTCTAGCEEGWYGEKCTNSCPSQCKEGVCSVKDGVCIHGCAYWWHGPYCDILRCPVNCATDRCSEVDGSCLDGCTEGTSGATCELNSDQSSSESSGLSVGAAAGITLSVTVVTGAAITTIIIILWRKRKRASKQDNHVPFTDVTSSPTGTSFTADPVYENNIENDTHVDNLLQALKHRTPGMLLAEFKELQDVKVLGTHTRKAESIVKYQTRGGCYLMTSLPPTQDALWRLIRENQCDAVVTLLTINEEQNVPHLVSVKRDQSGDYEKLSTHKPGFKTDFGILKAPPGQVSDSPQYHNISPDIKNQVGVFSITMEENMECLDPKSTIKVTKEIQAWCHQQRIVKPCILILCFDGVRYSGQFVAMCGLFEMINETKNVDVLRCVKKLKSIRHGFIGSMEQYLNLYEACREYIEVETNTYAAIQH